MGTIVGEITKNWQKVENNAIQEKSGVGFDTKLTLTTIPLVQGRYRIMFNGEARVKAGGLTSQPKFRVKVDGVTKMLRIFPADLEWAGAVGWDFMQFAEGDAPVIITEVQRFGGTETIEVRRLKLSIELMEL